MIPDTRVAVIGLGLMGGSLARALASRGARVLGYDRQVSYVQSAVHEGAVHEAVDADLESLRSAEVVVFALPADATREMLAPLAPKLERARLIMDLASTKRATVAAAERAGIGARYVGAHPLTGSHRSGWSASRATLFDDARIFLCPTAQTAPETLRLADSFWRALRAGAEVLDPATHDVQMAWRSHLPHMLSSLLAVTLHDAGIRRSALGPGGRDMTRLAGGSPSMWSGIVEENGAAIHEALLAFEHQIREMREALAGADATALRRTLDAGRNWFDGDPTEVIAPGSVRP